jgi:hypothetical protein
MSDRRMSILRKMMRRVEISTSPFYHGTPCWVWTGPTSGNGRGGNYPRMSMDGATVAVHIVMYTHVFGYVPYNKTIDHECKNRLCISPWHLSKVSMQENYRRRDGKPPRKGTEYNSGVPDWFLQELAFIDLSEAA